MTMTMRNNMRAYTNTLIELIKDGILDKDTVINACLQYMSEDEVEDMMRANDFIIQYDTEETYDE